MNNHVDDLRRVLASSSQQPEARDNASFDAVDAVLAEAGQPLVKSQRKVSELGAWGMLVDCSSRVAFGQVLTGKHRDYILAVLNKLLDPAVRTSREVRTFSKARGAIHGLIRTAAGWESDPDYITDEGIALAILVHKNTCKCTHTEAVAWAAEQLHKDPSHITKRESAYWKVFGVNRPRGRPKSAK
ncbi:MAG: hypothetical protein L0H70_04970 [Xanthomonadales bacterium]|nr:hypothetical protein [Xanthomonadales bacterium]